MTAQLTSSMDGETAQGPTLRGRAKGNNVAERKNEPSLGKPTDRLFSLKWSALNKTH